jgi:DNA-binding CsgD family transcriptional regulator
VLVGREVEQKSLEEMLARARDHQGTGLVVRGEPGIGKSALLGYAAERAAGLRVLRAVGVEAESTLAYAALHQLLLPILDRLDALPEPQAAALRTAFGLSAGEPTQPFLVSVAALTLLSEAGPVLCLVDDAHWCDGPSLDAFAFVARRLDAEAVCLLIAARDGEGRVVDAAGMAELHLPGLDDAAAATLLGDRISPALRDRFVASTGGNPLALIELPTATGRLAVPGAMQEPAPLAGKLERAFLDRTRRLSAPARTVLLVAAADGSGRREPIARAAAGLGVAADLLDAEDLATQLRVEADTVAFRHPLIRSAVYHGASATARRDAHRALAEALTGDDAQADRRAWHRAKAAEGPDEQVAGELEQTAAKALRRSGYAAAVAALERSAELSPAQQDRARRLAAAAAAAWRGGDTGAALALLDRTDELPPGLPAVAVHVRHLRGEIELRTGAPADALAILVPAAADAADVDQPLALRILLLAREAAYSSGETAALADIDRTVARLSTFDRPDDALLARALLFRPTVARPDQAPAVAEELARLDHLDDPDLLLTAGGIALWVGDHAAARRLRAKAVARARALGAAGTLALALEYLVPEETERGQFGAAEALAEEGRRLALETGRRNSAALHGAYLANLAGLRGRDREAEELAEQAVAEGVSRSLIKVTDVALRAKGLAALAARRPEDALTAFAMLIGKGAMPVSPSRSIGATPDYIEAAVRSGNGEQAAAALRPYLVWSEASTAPGLPALAARCQALLATTDSAQAHYEEALALHSATIRPFDHARTQLLYGEFLRREKQRTQARTQLRAAMDTFNRLGAPVWARRAETELRATGETARERNPNALLELTPQELQIAQAVGEGATNREIASQLFISPRTVDYHLGKVFRKLNISSRRELIRLSTGAG